MHSNTASQVRTLKRSVPERCLNLCFEEERNIMKGLSVFVILGLLSVTSCFNWNVFLKQPHPSSTLLRLIKISIPRTVYTKYLADDSLISDTAMNKSLNTNSTFEASNTIDSGKHR
ncbi:uncharacterized protein LOC143257466 [Tachypleus tridentatus]|uniref:uncharacterized protein LOC143257466 n=1 Tax=Tachypleus tridentatus TaxID=6853 RepID=UPI003FD1F12E